MANRTRIARIRCKMCSNMRVVSVLCTLMSMSMLGRSQVAPPAKAFYNLSEATQVFESFPPETAETLEEMTKRGAIDSFKYVCFTKAAEYGHSSNAVKDASYNNTLFESDPSFLFGTTYWMNDYLHVGHVHYDIGLVAAAQATKIDRIVMQRSACHGTLCVGVGTVDSFYKGYFASLLLAAGTLDTPVYIRFDGKNKNVIPLRFSTNSTDEYYNQTSMKTCWSNPIKLEHKMYFQSVIRRSNLHYGAIGAVSAEAVQKFKKAAYSLISDPPLPTYFESGPPYTILWAYRGNKASRQVQNFDEFVHHLQTTFPAPDYQLKLLNTSDPYLRFDTQLRAVAEAHVVLANHGAFEGNMIYMRNSSLLVELFGNYGNNEIHTFQRLAIMFGLYYARVHSETLVDHQAPYFNLTSIDMGEIDSTLKEYFQRKPYLLNQKPV